MFNLAGEGGGDLNLPSAASASALCSFLERGCSDLLRCPFPGDGPLVVPGMGIPPQDNPSLRGNTTWEKFFLTGQKHQSWTSLWN